MILTQHIWFKIVLITNKLSRGYARNHNDTSLRGGGWEGINKGEVIKASACPTRRQNTFHNQLFASLNWHISQHLGNPVKSLKKVVMIITLYHSLGLTKKLHTKGHDGLCRSRIPGVHYFPQSICSTFLL